MSEARSRSRKLPPGWKLDPSKPGKLLGPDGTLYNTVCPVGWKFSRDETGKKQLHDLNGNVYTDLVAVLLAIREEEIIRDANTRVRGLKPDLSPNAGSKSSTGSRSGSSSTVANNSESSSRQSSCGTSGSYKSSPNITDSAYPSVSSSGSNMSNLNRANVTLNVSNERKPDPSRSHPNSRSDPVRRDHGERDDRKKEGEKHAKHLVTVKMNQETQKPEYKLHIDAHSVLGLPKITPEVAAEQARLKKELKQQSSRGTSPTGTVGSVSSHQGSVLLSPAASLQGRPPPSPSTSLRSDRHISAAAATPPRDSDQVPSGLRSPILNSPSVQCATSPATGNLKVFTNFYEEDGTLSPLPVYGDTTKEIWDQKKDVPIQGNLKHEKAMAVWDKYKQDCQKEAETIRNRNNAPNSPSNSTRKCAPNGAPSNSPGKDGCIGAPRSSHNAPGGLKRASESQNEESAKRRSITGSITAAMEKMKMD